MEPTQSIEKNEKRKNILKNLKNHLPWKNNRKIITPVIINFFGILIAVFLLYVTHTFFWQYSGLDNQSIELGWLFLAPILFVFYSMVFWSFAFVVGKIFLSGLKKLQKNPNPPLIDLSTLAKLAVIILILLSIDLFYKTSLDKKNGEDELYNNQHHNNPWQIRDKQRSEDQEKIIQEILSYKNRFNKFPKDLSSLKEINYTAPADLLTKNQYKYISLDKNGEFAVCVEYENPTLDHKTSCALRGAYSVNIDSYVGLEEWLNKGTSLLNCYCSNKITTGACVNVNCSSSEEQVADCNTYCKSYGGSNTGKTPSCSSNSKFCSKSK